MALVTYVWNLFSHRSEWNSVRFYIALLFKLRLLNWHYPRSPLQFAELPVCLVVAALLHLLGFLETLNCRYLSESKQRRPVFPKRTIHTYRHRHFIKVLHLVRCFKRASKILSECVFLHERQIWEKKWLCKITYRWLYLVWDSLIWKKSTVGWAANFN